MIDSFNSKKRSEFLKVSELTKNEYQVFLIAMSIVSFIKDKKELLVEKDKNTISIQKTIGNLEPSCVVRTYSDDIWKSVISLYPSSYINLPSLNKNNEGSAGSISSYDISLFSFTNMDKILNNTDFELKCIISNKLLKPEEAYICDQGVISEEYIENKGVKKINIKRFTKKHTLIFKDYSIPLVNNSFYININNEKTFIYDVRIVVSLFKGYSSVCYDYVNIKKDHPVEVKVKYTKEDYQYIYTSVNYLKKMVNNNILFENYKGNFYANNPEFLNDKLTPRRENWFRFNNAHYKTTNIIKTDRNLGLYSPSNLISEFKDYTFGIEIETVSGTIPPHIAYDLNLSTSIDMSCNWIGDREQREYGGSGAEYVTGVLKGDAGFAHLMKICNILSERTTVNNTCSVHVHLGNFNFNKLNIIYLYKIIQDIEKEIFTLVPKSRTNNEYANKIKQLPLVIPSNINKDYFKIQVQKLYNMIFETITCYKNVKYPDSKICRKSNHPRGSRSGYDRSTPRYWWVNFIPALFNAKNQRLDRYQNKPDNNTIEFRLHGASTNYAKIRNWILLCMGILHVVENYKKEIDNRNLTINEIITLSYPKKHRDLIKYFEDRKLFFQTKKESEEYSAKHNPIIKNLTDVLTYL